MKIHPPHAFLVIGFLFALLTIACSEPNAKIAFISDRDWTEELYVMNADGSNVARLTDTGGLLSSFAAWSPDGRRIAFSSGEGGNHDIYLMNADGSDLVQLTHSDRHDSYPIWSPDGQRIAFVSGVLGDNPAIPKALDKLDDYDLHQLIVSYDIFIINTDGSGVVRLTDSAGFNFDPSWSPDGQRIAFVSDREGNAEIYTVNADGSDLTRLTHTSELAESYPVWSPDGQRIGYNTRDAKWPNGINQLEMHMMNADGSGYANLTPDAAVGLDDWFPVRLSPDMQRIERIAFFSDRDMYDGRDEMYITNADGSDLAQLAVTDSYQGPRDEKPVVFSTPYEGNVDDEIYIMNADGSGLVRLTDNTNRDFAPRVAVVP